jgi:hypothetical protein
VSAFQKQIFRNKQEAGAAAQDFDPANTGSGRCA